MKNHILMLVQENLFLKPEQREQLRAGIEDADFLTKNGDNIIQKLTAANDQEAVIIKEIVKRTPGFFRDIKQDKLKEMLIQKMAEESASNEEESTILEDFLEKEFSNIEL